MKSDFRIAIRTEGKWVVAYLAPESTMEGAMEVARVLRLFLKEEQQRDQLIAMLSAGLGEIIKMLGGSVEKWDTIPAPEHERGGNA